MYAHVVTQPYAGYNFTDSYLGQLAPSLSSAVLSFILHELKNKDVYLYYPQMYHLNLNSISDICQSDSQCSYYENCIPLKLVTFYMKHF
jgi:hypothetical protein